MAYVITRLCTDCLDLGCVDVCPVECIYRLGGTPDEHLPNMLYIHPTECISCGACESECPWEAIYEDVELPRSRADDARLNGMCEERPSAFEVARVPLDAHGRLIHATHPDDATVAANKRRWGVQGGRT